MMELLVIEGRPGRSYLREERIKNFWRPPSAPY